MRISAGTAKGLKLRSARGAILRPTAVKVKEALFDILGDKVVNTRFGDFFAGTGSVGIEALSRGAAHVVFVEHHRPSVHILKSNLLKSGFVEKATVYTMDVMTFFKKTRHLALHLDILFGDPPYHTPLAEVFLRHLGRSAIIKNHGIVILEHFHRTDLPKRAGHLVWVKRYRYGDTCLSFYQWMAEATEVTV